MPPWQTSKGKKAHGFEPEEFRGAWLDVGIGECPRCLVVRRMFRPVKLLDFYCCAPCVDVYTHACIPNYDSSEEEEDLRVQAALDEVAEWRRCKRIDEQRSVAA